MNLTLKEMAYQELEETVVEMQRVLDEYRKLYQNYIADMAGLKVERPEQVQAAEFLGKADKAWKDFETAEEKHREVRQRYWKINHQ